MEHGTLQLLFKGQVVQSVPLDRPMLTVGRLKENDVVIDNLSVSRLHARILLEGKRVFLEDQGSGNGCLVNGRRVDRAPIGPGDEILIGKHQLVLRAPGAQLEALPGGPAPKPEGQPDSSPWDGAHTYFIAREEDEPPKEEAPERHAGLIVQLRGELDRVVSVERTPFVIGRAPESDLVLTESGVSRQHARIVQDGEDFALEDLGGVNGTYLGGEPCERRVLEVGDEITLDVYQITFVLEDRPIAQEIHVAVAASEASDASPREAALAATQPPSSAVISDEGSTSASGLQDLGASGELTADVPVALVEPRPQAAVDVTVDPPQESRAISGPSEAEVGAPTGEERAAGGLCLELEVEPESLPDTLRAALLQGCQKGLRLPVTLRLSTKRCGD